jgi:hypothetical protein
MMERKCDRGVTKGSKNIYDECVAPRKEMCGEKKRKNELLPCPGSTPRTIKFQIPNATSAPSTNRPVMERREGYKGSTKYGVVRADHAGFSP